MMKQFIKFNNRIKPNDTYFMVYIIFKAIIILIILSVLWALENKDSVVLYMDF